MKIIKSGSEIKIYNKEIEVKDMLDPDMYKVKFSPNSGYSLENIKRIEAKEEKIYGKINSKVEKSLKSFNISSRNLGIILSGYKGTGKSLFSKILCKEAMKSGIPVIIIDGNTPGLSDFIDGN